MYVYINSFSFYFLVFLKIANVVGMCGVYYPMLACIALRRNFIANILGFIYVIPWYTRT